MLRHSSMPDLSSPDPGKLIASMTAMMQHACMGSDMSASFEMVCSDHVLGCAHAEVRLMAFQLAMGMDHTDSTYKALAPFIIKELSSPLPSSATPSPASATTQELRAFVFGVLGALPLPVFRDVGSAVGEALQMCLQPSSPSVVRESATTAVGNALLQGRPLVVGKPSAPLTQLYASEQSRKQLASASWTTLTSLFTDKDPLVAHAALAVLRRFIVQACDEDGKDVYQLLAEPSQLSTAQLPSSPSPGVLVAGTSPSLPLSLLRVLVCSHTQCQLLMATVKAMPQDKQWTAVLPMCVVILASAQHSASVPASASALSPLASLKLDRNVTQLCQSVLQPMLSATDPALVFEVGSALTAMKGLGLVPCQDIALSFLFLINREDIQHAHTGIIEKILLLLSHIPIGQQVGLVQRLLMTISKFPSQDLRVESFVLVFREWLSFILSQLSVIAGECEGVVPQLQRLAHTYELLMVSKLWENKWMAEVWRQEDDGNKLREELHVCLVESLCSLNISGSHNAAAWSAMLWECVMLCISGVTWGCGGRPDVFLAWLHLLHHALATVHPPQDLLASALNQTLSALQRMSLRLRVTALYTIAQYVREDFGPGILDSALGYLLHTLSEGGKAESQGSDLWIGAASAEQVVSGFADAVRPPSQGSEFELLELVVFSLVQFAVQCPSQRTKVRTALGERLASGALGLLEDDICRRAAAVMDQVLKLDARYRQPLTTAEIRKALSMQRDVQGALVDGVLATSGGLLDKSKFQRTLERTMERRVHALTEHLADAEPRSGARDHMADSAVERIVHGESPLSGVEEEVSVTGPSDPFDVSLSHTCFPLTHSLCVRVIIGNRTSEAVRSLKVVVGMEAGAAESGGVHNTTKVVETIEGRKSATLNFTFNVERFARQCFHVLLLVPADASAMAAHEDEEGDDDGALQVMGEGEQPVEQNDGEEAHDEADQVTVLCVRCVPYVVGLHFLTAPLSCSQEAFPVRFSHLLHVKRFTGVLGNGNTLKDLRAAFNAQPLACVRNSSWASGTCAQLAYVCESWFGDTIAFTATAQLNDADVAPHDLPDGALRPLNLAWGGLVVFDLRAGSEGALAAIESCFGEWFANLTAGTLVLMEEAMQDCRSISVACPLLTALTHPQAATPESARQVLERFRALDARLSQPAQ